MQARKAMAVGTALFCATGLVVLACGFPDVAIVGSDAAASSNDASTGEGRDAEQGLMRGDAAKIEGDACSGTSACDCDNDGYIAKSCDGGTDCDDFDALRHPNQRYVVEPPPAGSNGDWDCNGTEQPQYPTKMTCAVLGGEGAIGFVGEPKCGEEAVLIRCKAALGQYEDAGLERQGCK